MSTAEKNMMLMISDHHNDQPDQTGALVAAGCCTGLLILVFAGHRENSLVIRHGNGKSSTK